MKLSSDDRRTAWLEVFKGSNMPGDLSVTWVEPGAILAWHRHEQQDDWMLVVEGALKVGMWREPENFAESFVFYPGKVHLSPDILVEWHVLSDRNPEPLVIPRGLWHGYQNIGPGRACIVTYITQPYNPEDEFRLDPAAVRIAWERVPR